MKIALVHDHLNQLGGGERVLKALCEMHPEAPVYTLIYDPIGTQHRFDEYTIKQSFISHFPFARKKFRWYLPMMVPATESYDLSGYNVVFSDSSGLAKGVLTPPKTLHICYCHTPTRYLWSDHNEIIDKFERKRLIGRASQLYRSYLRIWDRLAADRVDRFIANSKFVAKRIQKYYKRDSVVINPPVNTDRFSITDSQDDYYLMITRLRPYKRVDIAIQAFNKLGLPLYIIGEGEDEDRLRSMAGPHIKFLGFVSDQKIAEYYSRCKAFIHPQEEDFGITCVEAMASGRPVIAYGSGGALETVVPGTTGVLFDEQSWEAIADTVIHFKPENFDSAMIRQHAEQFSVARFKDRISTFVEQAWQEFKNT
ncbi:MAG: glycosyltransferase [Patescibacteria group bacterium]|nr:glycosyltransferase [Patescibacteria group bacterium]MDD5715170.1 glycosyltransferase [Patescibacteria group bacterium]